MSVHEFLPYIAGALQWARAQKRFKDVWFLLIVASASFAFYVLANPTNAFSQPWSNVLAGWWEQAKTILATVQAVSSGSNVINDMRGSAAPPPVMLPVTDSKS